MEVEKVGPSKAEDVVQVCPLGDLDRDNGVKAGDGQLKDAPKEVILITRLRSDQSKGSVDLWGEVSVDETREEFHESLAHHVVLVHAKARNAEAFQTVPYHDRVERHDSNGKAGGGLLQTIVEVDHRLSRGQVQCREELEGLGDNALNLWAVGV